MILPGRALTEVTGDFCDLPTYRRLFTDAGFHVVNVIAPRLEMTKGRRISMTLPQPRGTGADATAKRSDQRILPAMCPRSGRKHKFVGWQPIHSISGRYPTFSGHHYRAQHNQGILPAHDHYKLETIDFQAKLDILCMDSPITPPYPFRKIGSRARRPRPVNIRRCVNILVIDAFINVFSTGKILVGPAAVTGDDECRVLRLPGPQELCCRVGHYETRTECKWGIRDSQRTDRTCRRLLDHGSTGQIVSRYHRWRVDRVEAGRRGSILHGKPIRVKALQSQGFFLGGGKDNPFGSTFKSPCSHRERAHNIDDNRYRGSWRQLRNSCESRVHEVILPCSLAALLEAHRTCLALGVRRRH